MQSIWEKRMTQNQLKTVAAIAMMTDHVGAELFPRIILLRVIGRLAFPVFSYFLYEGFHYTSDKKKYFFRLFFLGMVCVAGYYLYSGELYGNVLITFSASIVVLYGLGVLRHSIAGSITDKIYALLLVGTCLALIWLINTWIYIDYGMIGILLPAFAELTSMWNKKRNQYRALAGFSAGLLLLAIQMGGIQYFSILAIPWLCFYNGQRGERNLKKFFYWFYPVHLVAIGILAMVIG